VLVRLDRTGASLLVGDTLRPGARGFTRGGREVAGGFTWTSTDPAVAAVDAGGRVVAAGVGRARVVVGVGGAAAADTLDLVVDSLYHLRTSAAAGCDETEPHLARPVARGRHVLVLEDTANPPGGFSAGEYAAVAADVDTLVWPLVTRAFGEPTDLDGNGRVLVVYTRGVNALTPPRSDSFVGGLFAPRDLLPRRDQSRFVGCPSSQEAEVLYLLAPDPAGAVGGNERPASLVRRITVGTLAHELQHLVNAGARLHRTRGQPFEASWLSEGLSHAAEELLFYAAAGSGPRRRLGPADVAAGPLARAYDRYALADVERLSRWYLDPAAQGMLDDDADIATRGAAWQFLRYAADRLALAGGPAAEDGLWRRLAGSATAGVANVEGVIATPLDAWIHDWAVASLVDAAGPPAGVPARWTHPSWQYAALLADVPDLGPDRLRVRDARDGDTLTVRAGGAAYLRLRAAAPARVAFAAGAAGAAGECLTVRVAAGAALAVPDSLAARPLCLADPGEYVAVVTARTLASGAGVALQLAATGLQTGPVLAARPRPAAARLAAGPSPAGPVADWTAEARWQRRLVADAAARVRDRPAARLPSAHLAAAADRPSVRVTVLRVR
jgi:hypothetical protein